MPDGARVIVALSGGADSVCLLHVLCHLAPRAVAGVAHFNHHWRAEASNADEQFVADLASRFGLKFFQAEAHAAPNGNLEQEARRERHEFFSSLGPTVALGHTRDDQAETVLFRLLRGSGLTGLAAIPPVSGHLIRPLIDVTRAEVEAFLRSQNIPWREDASNLDPSFARNRIRHRLLPQLASEWNPKIQDALAHLADLAREEETYWQSEIAKFEMFFINGGVELRASVLAALPKAMARRLIRRAIELAKGNLRGIDFQHVEVVFDLRHQMQIPGLTLTRSFDWLRFSSSPATAIHPPQEIAPPGVYPSPDGLTQICVDLAQPDPPDPCATLKVEVPLRTPLQLRGWQPGDRYRPQGQSRDHKIQEMFQKARIPSWRRSSWPILLSGDRILWSRQFGVAKEFFAAAEERVSEQTALLRIWERRFPEP